jgi:hypothetical protein
LILICEYNIYDSRHLHCFPSITVANTIFPLKLTVCMIHKDAQIFYPAVLDFEVLYSWQKLKSICGVKIYGLIRAGMDNLMFHFSDTLFRISGFNLLTELCFTKIIMVSMVRAFVFLFCLWILVDVQTLCFHISDRIFRVFMWFLQCLQIFAQCVKAAASLVYL